MGETSNSLKSAAAIIAGLSRIESSVSATSATPPQRTGPVLLALREFDACVRYLNTRRSAGAIIKIESEADVQDVLYLLLRPWVVDLVYESPADKSGNRYAIKDFSSAAGRFVVDAKYIRDEDHGRLVSKELHDDIEMYRTHPRCDDLIFFVYDPNALIPDQRALREAIEIDRAYGHGADRQLKCHLIVKP
jgi:hypothetical protein